MKINCSAPAKPVTDCSSSTELTFQLSVSVQICLQASVVQKQTIVSDMIWSEVQRSPN